MKEHDVTKATFEDAIHCAKSSVGLEMCEECRLYNLCHTFCHDAQRMIVEAMKKQVKLKEYIERINQPEYNEVIWKKDEVVMLLQELLADRS